MSPQAEATPDAPLVWLCIDYRQALWAAVPKVGYTFLARVMSYREKREVLSGDLTTPPCEYRPG